MIHVCVPVLKRYDLLRKLLESLEASLVQPDCVFILDNGMNEDALSQATKHLGVPVIVDTPEEPLGVAASWNWFIKTADEERIIVNDDVQFAPESLGLLLASKADLVWAEGLGFSCFVIRDRCVEKLGLFDETISPGYGYYEDEDYLQRLDGRGTRPPSAIAENVACGALHEHSATLKAALHDELLEHHRRFKIAQSNYARKWNIEEAFK
jgi:GT2 family glycosyltransferase